MSDENKQKRKFKPDEVWVLPARKREQPENPDADDAAKKRSASAETIEVPSRARVIVQAGFGLCVSFVLAACGSRDKGPTHVGPPLGDTHVSQAPTDPTVPPPDASIAEEPSPGYRIQAPVGNAPVQGTDRQPQVPAQAPTSDQQQPGVFSPPPPSENQPGASQPQIPQPAPPSTTPLPQDTPRQ